MATTRRTFLGMACGLCSGLLLPGAVRLDGSAAAPTGMAPTGPASTLHPARHFESLAGGRTRCRLCPNECERGEGERSRCHARETRDGKLYSLVYGRPCVVSLDPLEKCPLFHFRRGGNALSIATAGCNLGCRYCQNWQFSQKGPEETSNFDLLPRQVIEKAREYKAQSIAFFYTEPTIAFEFVADVAAAAKKAGLPTVLVTAGFIREEPLRELLPLIDAFTVGLKGFTEKYYHEVIDGTLEPVLKALTTIAAARRHLEIVTLLVPTLNDAPEAIAAEIAWIREHLGTAIPLHFTRFVPQYRLKRLPPTPAATLEAARKRALEAGLQFVYTGNLPGHEGNHTVCPKCRTVLVERLGFQVLKNSLVHGKCPSCATAIPGAWE